MTCRLAGQPTPKLSNKSQYAVCGAPELSAASPSRGEFQPETHGGEGHAHRHAGEIHVR